MPHSARSISPFPACAHGSLQLCHVWVRAPTPAVRSQRVPVAQAPSGVGWGTSNKMAWALGDTGVKAALYFWAPEVPLLRGQSGLFRKARPGDVCVYDLPAVGREQVTELPLTLCSEWSWRLLRRVSRERLQLHVVNTVLPGLHRCCLLLLFHFLFTDVVGVTLV